MFPAPSLWQLAVNPGPGSCPSVESLVSAPPPSSHCLLNLPFGTRLCSLAVPLELLSGRFEGVFIKVTGLIDEDSDA